jgi:TPR repeat protein
MIKFLIALAFAAGPIDLDVAGNLEAVQRERPEHYAKIERILAEAPKRAMDTKGVARWLQTDFAATDVGYTDLLKTSMPPKKRLAFTLDNTAYTKIIVVDSRAEAMRAARTLVERARAGDCHAAKRLGDIYRDGAEGVARDPAESMKWYNAARVLGCEVP